MFEASCIYTSYGSRSPQRTSLARTQFATKVGVMPADVFLMGTAGKYGDPKRSMWREPIKAACAKHGITCFDPVVPNWDDEAMRREVEALRTARVVVMAITADTSGIASLAESGWAALSALARRQAFGLYVDNMFVAEGFNPRVSQDSRSLIEYLFGKDADQNPTELADVSRRARKLVSGHAAELARQFPQMNLYVAPDLESLTTWTVETALKMLKQSPPTPGMMRPGS
jgi:hypothetical protein